ncbi:Autoinducer 2 sensor kinase/phosphatase LuxQ [Marinomonas spartinae]|uniref:ATP-binding response regulator n=1 Tax=Marinomonas spartinae TaxID=1792290 RepID=UPI00080905D3|nr:response regulator [Marinomonas spartinae]SBS38836.1 Autoinducer 2 sensor kinase/phosphatase LuxQ [Marinomonas spartinae]
MPDFELFDWVLFLFVVVFFIGSLLLARQWRALSLEKERHYRAIHNAQFGLWQWFIKPDRFELSLDFIEGFDEHHLQVQTKDDWLEHLSEYDKEAFIDWLMAIKEGSSEPGLRLSMSSEHGVAHWIEMRGSVVESDGDNQPTCIAGTVHCIYHLVALQESFLKETTRKNKKMTTEEALYYLGENADVLDGVEVFGDEVLQEEAPHRTSPALAAKEQNSRISGINELHIDPALQKEAQQQQSQSYFLANMSHEIRTPLNAIIGYAQLLSEDTHFEGVAHTRFQAIIAAGERLLNMLNDIIDIARIEAGRLDLQGHKIKLHKEINQAIDVISQTVEDKGLDLRVNNQVSEGLCVLGDSVKLQRIFHNILTNAAKFTHHGYVSVSALYENEILRLTIQDTGVGMDDQLIEHLFTPFVQERNGCAEKSSGLGLALTNTLVKLMEGQLNIDSVLEEGTKVTILLPLKEEVEDIMPILSGEDMSHLHLNRGIQVLVADDDDWSRDILITLLEKAGCRVWEAENGEEALALFKKHSPDLVLTDIRMPKMDGRELLQAIRVLPQAEPIPIIAVTASTLIQEHQALIDVGFWEVISKPYKVAELYQSLVNHIEDLSFVYDKEVPETGEGKESHHPESDDDMKATPQVTSLTAEDWRPLLFAAKEGDIQQAEKCFHSIFHSMPSQQRHAIRQALEQFDLGLVEQHVKQYCPEAIKQDLGDV